MAYQNAPSSGSPRGDHGGVYSCHHSTVARKDSELQTHSIIENRQIISNILATLDELQRKEMQAIHTCAHQREELQTTLHRHFEMHGADLQCLNQKLHAVESERNQLRYEVGVLRMELEKIVKNQQGSAPSVVSPSAHLADGASGADLIQGVQRLNDEIFQFAACLADDCEKQPEKCTPKIKEELKSLFGSSSITEFVVQAMAQAEHSWSLQAVQTCTIACCVDVLRSLVPYLRKSNRLERAYRNIREAEGQGVSGHWRSLFYRHSSRRTAERDIYEKMAFIIQYICHILGLGTMKTTHYDALKSIVSKMLDLHKIMCVDVVSGDIKVIFPEPGAPFDPETMELSDGRNVSAAPPRDEHVLCTTDIGLTKSFAERLYTKEKWTFREQTITILKARVLESPSETY